MQTGLTRPASPQGHSQSLREPWHQSSRWWRNDGPSLVIQQRRWLSFVRKRLVGILLLLCCVVLKNFSMTKHTVFFIYLFFAVEVFSLS